MKVFSQKVSEGPVCSCKKTFYTREVFPTSKETEKIPDGNDPTNWSAADMKWVDTIQVIAAQHGQWFKDDHIQNMTWERKAFCLRTNPMTATRHFDHRLQLFMDILVYGQSRLIGQVVHFRYCIEIQQWGSPHSHMVVWMKDPPHISEDTKESVHNFVSEYVSCTMPQNDSLI